MNPGERNYSATEKEALGVVWACDYFRAYVLGSEFQIITDHAALQWLLSKKDQSGILSRWNQRLSEYHYTIAHRAGKSIPHVDALSRNISVNAINKIKTTLQQFKEAQEKDISLDVLKQQVGKQIEHTHHQHQN